MQCSGGELLQFVGVAAEGGFSDQADAQILCYQCGTQSGPAPERLLWYNSDATGEARNRGNRATYLTVCISFFFQGGMQ
jgi:hypothetical protein